MSTYTDRELLELAAQAIGGKLSEGQGKRRTGDTWDEWEWYGPLGINTPEGTVIYPLTSNGDALRLAVRLNIPVFPYDNETSTGTVGVVAKNWGSKEENTRRAIVCAAAQQPTQPEGDGGGA